MSTGFDFCLVLFFECEALTLEDCETTGQSGSAMSPCQGYLFGGSSGIDVMGTVVPEMQRFQEIGMGDGQKNGEDRSFPCFVLRLYA